MAKKIYNASSLVTAPSSMRIPFLGDGGANQPKPKHLARHPDSLDGSGLPGCSCRAKLLSLSERTGVDGSEWYVWEWQSVGEGDWLRTAPPGKWRWCCVTETSYSSRSALKVLLDRILGEERDGQEWRTVGLSHLVGLVYWLEVERADHRIVPVLKPDGWRGPIRSRVQAGVRAATLLARQSEDWTIMQPRDRLELWLTDETSASPSGLKPGTDLYMDDLVVEIL